MTSIKATLSMTIALLAASLVRVASAETFSYSVPVGFTDLSSTAPSENFASLPSEILERSRKFRVYAVALEKDVPIGELTITVGKAEGSVSDSIGIIASLAARSSPTGFRLLAKDFVTIRDVECGRVEFVASVRGVELRKLAYVVPPGPERAWVALEASPDAFPKLLPGFTESLSSIHGIQQSQDASENTARLGAILALGAVGAVIGRALRGRRRRKK